MDRLIATASVNLAGADTAPVGGTPQYATSGNPGVTPATVFPAYQYNAIQEELLAVITSANLTFDRNNNAQLAASIGRGRQCRLTLSGSNLLLKPYNGNKIFIPGTGLMTVPSAGASVAVGATLTEGGTPGASTVYYVYAYNNSGTLAIQLSATTHATDTNTGIEIRSGDATRALVGMVKTTAGTAFADTPAQRFVISWFNSRPVGGVSFFTANRATTSTTYVELNTEIRVEFLVWADRGVVISYSGGCSTSAGATSGDTALSIDGGAAQEGSWSSTASSTRTGVAATILPLLSEGYHFVTLVAAALSGASTVTLVGGATAGQRTAITIQLQA